LETVRQYAAQQLRESGEEEAVRDRHADFFLALAEEAELVDPAQEAWLDRLNLERHHFWDALGWLEKGDAGRGLRLVVALRVT